MMVYTYVTVILYSPFGCIASKDFLNKIIWLSNILVLSVPDESYSRNASCALNLISTFFFIIMLVVRGERP